MRVFLWCVLSGKLQSQATPTLGTSHGCLTQMGVPNPPLSKSVAPKRLCTAGVIHGPLLQCKVGCLVEIVRKLGDAEKCAEQGLSLFAVQVGV